MRARQLQTRIKQLEDAKADAWERATYSGHSSSTTSMRTGAFSRKAEAYSEYIDKIDVERVRLAEIKTEILGVINQVPDNTLAALLTAYYINGKTWEQTAVEIHYSYFRTVHDKHPQALAAVDEILKKRSDKKL